MDFKKKTEEEWKKKLTSEEYRVLRQKGTEALGSGKFYQHFEDGMYVCAACGQDLFDSSTKFNNDCGWPSFDRSLKGNITFQDDDSFGMHRTEVLCNNCGSHLGHVFDDGPQNLPDGRQATGKRFCINSVALGFKPAK